MFGHTSYTHTCATCAQPQTMYVMSAGCVYSSATTAPCGHHKSFVMCVAARLPRFPVIKRRCSYVITVRTCVSIESPPLLPDKTTVREDTSAERNRACRRINHVSFFYECTLPYSLILWVKGNTLLTRRFFLYFSYTERVQRFLLFLRPLGECDCFNILRYLVRTSLNTVKAIDRKMKCVSQ